jgi:hypothetical protein
MLLFRAALGFLIAYAVAEPQAVARYFETPQIELLKTDLARAETEEAARYSASHPAPVDAAIFEASWLLHASAHESGVRGR